MIDTTTMGKKEKLKNKNIKAIYKIIAGKR